MKFDLLSTVQLFRKLTRDVRSYVQKVYLPSSFSLLLGEHAKSLCFNIYLLVSVQ